MEKWVEIRDDLSKLDKRVTREPNMELFGHLRKYAVEFYEKFKDLEAVEWDNSIADNYGSLNIRFGGFAFNYPYRLWLYDTLYGTTFYNQLLEQLENSPENKKTLDAFYRTYMPLASSVLPQYTDTEIRIIKELSRWEKMPSTPHSLPKTQSLHKELLNGGFSVTRKTIERSYSKLIKLACLYGAHYIDISRIGLRRIVMDINIVGIHPTESDLSRHLPGFLEYVLVPEGHFGSPRSFCTLLQPNKNPIPKGAWKVEAFLRSQNLDAFTGKSWEDPIGTRLMSSKENYSPGTIIVQEDTSSGQFTLKFPEEHQLLDLLLFYGSQAAMHIASSLDKSPTWVTEKVRNWFKSGFLIRKLRASNIALGTTILLYLKEGVLTGILDDVMKKLSYLPSLFARIGSREVLAWLNLPNGYISTMFNALCLMKEEFQFESVYLDFVTPQKSSHSRFMKMWDKEVGDWRVI